ncbi:hypothetical protein [Thermococcus thermotolerans]|nr:hypothetical protein [Thermococcus thermotolerans]
MGSTTFQRLPQKDSAGKNGDEGLKKASGHERPLFDSLPEGWL